MSGRLASFRGPSTPTASPAQVKQQVNSPSSPSRSIESTYHRKTRTLLLELRLITETWDDLVLIDGLKAVKSLVDARTDLDNQIALVPDKKPRTMLVGPKLQFMEKCLADLDIVVSKLVRKQKQFRRMNTVIESIETVLFEATKIKGWQWAHEEPLWVTWSLEKFVSSVASVVVPYHRSLNLVIELASTLRSHSISFEDSRTAISRWVAQPWLEDEAWDAKWEDICEIEVERWDR